MNQEQKYQLVEALEAYLTKHELSQAEMAKISGVNASYLGPMRKKDFFVNVSGRKTEITDKYFNRVAKAIGFSTEKQYWPTRKTLQLKVMFKVLQDSKRDAQTAVLIGETGCGKSYTAELFKSNFPAEVFIIKVGSSDNLDDLIDKVIEELKIKNPYRTKSARLRQIAARLKEMNEDGYEPSLIFDESEYMKLAALCAMKELIDVLSDWCSLALVGAPELLKTIEKLKRLSKPGISQLYRRIKFRIRRMPAIDRNFTEFLTGIEPGLKNWLKANCENYGELNNVLVPAMREADRLGCELTEEFVQKVLSA